MNASKQPDSAPHSIDSTLEWARHLRTLDPADRQSFFEDWDVTSPRSFDDHQGTLWILLLRHLFPGEEEPGVRIDELVPLVVESGRSRDEALEALVPFVDLAPVQESWSDWKDVEARRELRLRLEILEHVPTLRDELIPFLDFFFRASDPSLYQAAALAIGRHLPEHEALRDLIREYSSDRDLDLDAAVVLNGRRSRRRLLLVKAAFRIHHSREDSPGKDFLPTSGPVLADAGEVDPDTFARKILPADVADRGIVLKYLAILLEGGSPGEVAGQLHEPVLRETVETFQGDLNHDLVARWNELFLAATRSEQGNPEPLADLWFTAHEYALETLGASENFQSRYRVLNGWDTLLRTAVRSPDPLAQKLIDGSKADLPEGDRELHRLRIRTWLQRENRSMDLNSGTLTRAAPPVLSDHEALKKLSLEMSRRDPGRITNTRENEIIDALRTVTAHFRSRSGWTAQTPRNRALRFFVVIDSLLRTDLPSDVLEAALPEHSSRRTGAAPETSRGGLPNAAVQIVQNVLRWEQPGVESFLHGDLIHEIGDLRLLLALLPSNRSGSTLSVLADAFEHQFRLELNRNPALDVSRYLLLITVRDPHPDFYRELARVTDSREYESDRGSIPLHDFARNLHDQVSRAGQLSASPDAEGILGFPRKYFPEAARSFELADRITELRNLLLEEESEFRDPRPLLNRLLRVLVGESPEEPADSVSVLGLLEGFYDSDDHVLQSGFPAYRRQTFSQYHDELKTNAELLRAKISTLDPSTLISTEHPDHQQNSIREALDEFSREFLPALPNVEESLLGTFLAVLQTTLQKWVQYHRFTTEALEAVYRTEEPTVTDYDDLFDPAEEPDRRLDEETKVYLFEHLLSLIQESDETERQDLTVSERTFAAATDELDDQSDLIRSGLRHLNAGEDVFRDVLSDAWRNLTQQCMERGDVPATLDLLQSADFQTVRRLSDNNDFLKTAREWALNRYRIGLSYSLSRQLDGGDSQTSVLGETWRFISHYSPVWLALLVGAILMLDFGDPWTAMAREGDTTGIGITFGVGVASTFFYILADLRSKGRPSGERSVLSFWGERLLRSLGFLTFCLVYTFLVVGVLWYLLSGTGEVLRGSEAVAHVIVWTGFSLFAGVFMGLLAQNN